MIDPVEPQVPYTVRLKEDTRGIKAGTIGTVVAKFLYTATVEFTIGDTVQNHYHKTETIYYSQLEVVEDSDKIIWPAQYERELKIYKAGRRDMADDIIEMIKMFKRDFNKKWREQLIEELERRVQIHEG